MGARDSTLETLPTQPNSSRAVLIARLLFTGQRVCREPPVELPSGETLVGRDVGAGGLRLDDAHASRLHARITVDALNRRVVVRNESRRGIEVDGAPVERAEVGDGAVLFAGHSALALRWEPRPAPVDAACEGLLGDALAMRQLRALVALLAPSDVVVTIAGETGTGKELVAQALHRASKRRGPLVAVNCAAIPEALAESQLFGHVAGAFTGARAPVDGYFRAAGGGTLFLDEVGELSPAVQAKLLRALETGAVAPLGSFHETAHQTRVITATHRDLTDDVRAGRFRADLYARISDAVLALPPLRARREDVLAIFQAQWPSELPPMEFALARALLLHPWPFNVRELVRLAGQLRLRAAKGGVLELEHAADALARGRSLAPQGTRLPEPASVPPRERAGPPSRDELTALLREHGGVVSEVARVVGRSRKQVYRWIESHGIDPESFREG